MKKFISVIAACVGALLTVAAPAHAAPSEPGTASSPQPQPPPTSTMPPHGNPNDSPFTPGWGTDSDPRT